MLPRITLDTQIRHPGGTRTLAVAMAAARRLDQSELLAGDDDAADQALAFQIAIERGRAPTVKQILAAWHTAKMSELRRHYAANPAMTYNAYRKRLARIRRRVFSDRPFRRVNPDRADDTKYLIGHRTVGDVQYDAFTNHRQTKFRIYKIVGGTDGAWYAAAFASRREVEEFLNQVEEPR